MAGHSKFANIRHRKEKNDSVKARVFTRIGREIAVSVKMGGADAGSNVRLRDAIAKAKAENMPNDTIERSIKKAAGDLSAINFEPITYEGYGVKGVAVIVKVLTNNRNRTAANVRNAFTKGGGNMGTTGCAAYFFDESMTPVSYIDLIEPDDIKKMNKLLDLLDEDEDVQEVFHNVGNWS
ncbi:MAG: YebC/PmpR family DNA-binding transcriptional regulator [Turicibacter sp.]|nr:YebC/PmpR family DNA-binding transcriptional regulator [Turicibacter sp.]